MRGGVQAGRDAGCPADALEHDCSRALAVGAGNLNGFKGFVRVAETFKQQLGVTQSQFHCQGFVTETEKILRYFRKIHAAKFTRELVDRKESAAEPQVRNWAAR
jgi:hypothetical protein